MLIAHYIGDHAGDTLFVRLGWALIRLAQKGPFERVTHCEAILSHEGRVATIASSSARDGGVRIKRGVTLDPAHWLITDVAQWHEGPSHAWFLAHDGQGYDWRGAWAAVMPGKHKAYQQFCTEAVAASVGLRAPETFTPALFAAVCMSFGRDVTREFFEEPSVAAIQQ